jgi:hypothetical protein
MAPKIDLMHYDYDDITTWWKGTFIAMIKISSKKTRSA